MKKCLRWLSLVLICLFTLNTVNTTVFASESISPKSSLYIIGSDAEIIPQSNGKLTISFWITGTNVMSEIGATSIDLYEDNGHSTSLIKTYRYTDLGYSHLMGTGKLSHRSEVTYNGTVGYRYYAEVHLTARDSSGSDSIIEIAPLVTAKKNP